MIRKTRWDGEGFNRYIYLESVWGYPAKWLKLDEDVLRKEIKRFKAFSKLKIYNILVNPDINPITIERRLKEWADRNPYLAVGRYSDDST